MVDAFMRDQVDAMHERLEAANRWRRDGRQYRLDPPLPRGDAAAAFAAGGVDLAPAPPRRMPIRTILAIATVGAAYALIALPDMVFAFRRLLQFLAMG